MDNTSPKTAIISILNNFNKEMESISIVLKEQLIFNIKNINIIIIDTNAYYITYYLKKAQVFFISLTNF